MKVFITLLLLGLIIEVQAQEFISASGNTVMRQQKYSDFAEKALLYPSSRMAEVYTKDGGQMDNIKVNFNKILGVFVGEVKGRELLLNQYQYSKFVTLNEGEEGNVIKETFKNLIDPKHPEKYFQVLYENDSFKFLKLHEAKVVEGGSFNYGKASDSNYVKNKTNYYFFQENQLKKIKLKEKDILKPFDKTKRTVKKYAKDNGLSFKKEMDIVMLLGIYGGNIK